MVNKLKVLHLVDHIRDVGNGITNVVIDLSIEMSAQGIKTGIFSSGGDFNTLLETNNVTSIRSEKKGKLCIARDLAKFLDAEGYRIVHIHTPKMAEIYLIANLFTKYKYLPLTTIHNSFQKSSWLLSLFKNVVCLSQSDIRKFTKINKVSIFHKVINGTFGSRRIYENQYPPYIRDPNSIIFTTVANMCHRKGIDILLTVFSEIAKAHPTSFLNLVGDGIEINKFKSLSKSLGVERNVKFWGKVKNPKSIISSSDVFVLASRRDPCPLVIFEAMECGVAILGSNADGIPEQLGYGDYGSVFKNRDELKAEMLNTIHNPNHLNDLKRKSQEGLEKFNLLNTTQKYITIYKEISYDN
ncbi:glycosyltransferase family 4 protein [Hydrogenophaga aromaticivorans]|uniref:glycosyltransferase family 4 protein n=1 Tax=Hydrogenophaga aromaticivorans TaxID=2610898 RepID=UPI001B372270|nr:glycosyltransferase family 4 protein [Hydrogenophaga aromaticivorans]MBQ0921634.1 glycosyltransferase family 4 protein [Hydrogenophaga aromaticivorans]